MANGCAKCVCILFYSVVPATMALRLASIRFIYCVIDAQLYFLFLKIV